MAVQVEALEWRLGDRLARAREHAGLDQKEMARLLTERTGIHTTQGAVSKWERNAGQPRNLLKIVNAWAEISGVSVTWLLGVDPRYACLTADKLRYPAFAVAS